MKYEVRVMKKSNDKIKKRSAAVHSIAEAKIKAVHMSVDYNQDYKLEIWTVNGKKSQIIKS